MSVICVNPQSDDLWTTLTERRSTSVFVAPPWIRVLAATYDMDVRAQVLIDDCGRPIAGLPYCVVDDMNGRRIVILPFSDYCDPMVDDAGHWETLVEALLSEKCPISLRCLHNEVPLTDPRFERYYQAKWHGVALQPELATIWGKLHSSARRAIRKAQNANIEVRFARGQDALRAFFELHLQVRKYKYRLLAQPYRFFEQIWRQFIEPECGTIALAVDKGQVIAGILFLEWQNCLYYKFNASSVDHQHLRPNDLIMWEGIRYGKERGYGRLDLGLSDWDQDGLIRYKRKYAGEEKAISFLRHVPDGYPDARTQQIRNLLPQITDLFTDASVPDQVTERAGEVLYRFFV